MNGVRLFTLLGITLAVFLHAPSAQAQQPRSWISGANGDDLNPCTRTAPCRTFSGAISKTNTGGEMDLLDPHGAGTVAINKSMTIDGGNGQGANINASGVNGIIVNTGTVILRNLRINGTGTGLNGIVIKAGARVLIENCEIYGFASHGILIEISAGLTQVVINKTTLFGNGQGGIQVKPSGGATTVSVNDVQANGNGFGIGVDTTGGGTASVIIDHSNVSENAGNGVQAAGSGTTVEVGFSTLVHNGFGVNVTSPANAYSFLNNIIAQSVTNNIQGTFGTKPLQ